MFNTRVIKYISSCMIVLCTVFSARAGVEIAQSDARLHFGSEQLPDNLDSGRWSLLVWIHAPQAVSTPSSLIAIGGHLVVAADAQGVSVRAQHRDRGAVLRIDQPLRSGQWHLLAISMDVVGNRAQAWLATQPAGSGVGAITADSARLEPLGRGRSIGRAARQGGDPVLGPWQPGGPSAFSAARSIVRDPLLLPDQSGLTIGTFIAGVPALRLVYDALTIRDHPINDTDVAVVWHSRDYYGPYRLDTRDDGGAMNGWMGARLFTFHGMCARPYGPGELTAKASWPGAPVTTSNVLVVDRPTPMEPRYSGLFSTVKPIKQATGAVIRSRLEPGLDGFFSIEPAPFDAPTEPVGQLGPKAAQLVTGPQGLVRVMVSANSRGVRGTLAPQPWPENFAHGFIQVLLPQTAGVLMRPPSLLDARGGWFGFDTTHSSPETVNVRVLHARDDAWADWTRFGSGTLPGASRGPGPAVSVLPGGAFRLRCGPVEGSLLVADAALVVRSTVLAFPGSSPMDWYPERGALQDGEGLQLADPIRVLLDTTRFTHIMTGLDTVVDDVTLVLAGVHDVRVGDALVPLSGPARGGVTTVVGVHVDTDRTTISFSHPIGGELTDGSELRIGPWRFVSVEHRFDAVPDTDDQNWRGQVLQAANDGNLGVMVYALSAWRPDVDGYIFGTAGQGGKGYTPQLANAFPGATAAWARETQADVWIQGIAGQSSQPSAMHDYLDVLREGLGADAEIIWASDAVHAHATHAQWHYYLRDQSAAVGVPAIFAVGHPRVGSYFAQAASGMRTDDAHFSSFGDRVIAEVWLDQLRLLAGGLCGMADYNQDGSIDVFDLLSFQTEWEARNPRADLDGDGQFTLFDFLVLLTAIDQCR